LVPPRWQSVRRTWRKSSSCPNETSEWRSPVLAEGYDDLSRLAENLHEAARRVSVIRLAQKTVNTMFVAPPPMSIGTITRRLAQNGDDMLRVEPKARTEVKDLSSRIDAVADSRRNECDDTMVLVRTTLIEQPPEARERIGEGGGTRPHYDVSGRAFGRDRRHRESFRDGRCDPAEKKLVETGSPPAPRPKPKRGWG
jgi:hypothetical protein